MKDIWYADKRDLIKWSVLLRLANLFEAARILQVAYYRPNDWEQILIDGQPYDIPQEVLAHFRDIRTVSSINSNIRVTVYNPMLQDRDPYLEGVIAFLSAFKQERCVVFLDPDTGLEPQAKPKLDHVLESEVRDVWEAMESDDLLVFYQHKPMFVAPPWIEPKRNQLAEAIDMPIQSIKIAEGPSIAKDVVFFYAQKI